MHPALRLLRTTSFRLAALYVGLFAVSALVLGAVVFLTARSALEQQMTARVETEMAYLQDEFHAGGLNQLLIAVRSRGRGISALDYLVQDAAGTHLAGEMHATLALRPGWATIGWQPGRHQQTQSEPAWKALERQTSIC